MPSRKSIPKGKVQLNILISKDVYELLVRLAPEIYGAKKHRGALSYVVEEALRQYLYPRLHTQKHANPQRSVRLVYEAVVGKLMEVMGLPYKPAEVPERILDLAIAEVRGSDPRTVEKWKRVFEASGLIKYVGGYRPNRIVELM